MAVMFKANFRSRGHMFEIKMLHTISPIALNWSKEEIYHKGYTQISAKSNGTKQQPASEFKGQNNEFKSYNSA